MCLLKQGELDELEREEFFRLKKVQAKKKRDASLNDAAVSPLPHLLLPREALECLACLQYFGPSYLMHRPKQYNRESS